MRGWRNRTICKADTHSHAYADCSVLRRQSKLYPKKMSGMKIKKMTEINQFYSNYIFFKIIKYSLDRCHFITAEME